MLKQFIKEYKTTYELSVNEGELGKFERFKQAISEPKFRPSQELLRRLDSIHTLYFTPSNVAIVGQFSSGKSSFINALLGEDVLPTGVVPVTAKPTHIRYAPFPMLKAQFNNGREEYHSISELKLFVDQRVNIKDVAYIAIYMPHEMLKSVSLIDTPGLNSLSDADTMETKKILQQADALIWVSLIDNAARQSEIDDLELIPHALRQNAVCLLNQKDKLSEDQIRNVMKHANITYQKYFSKILAVSSKMHREGNSESGFGEVMSFVMGMEAKKQSYIKSSCESIAMASMSSNERFLDILRELKQIFVEFDVVARDRIDELRATQSARMQILFDAIKASAHEVATEINKHLVSQKTEYFKQKKALFSTRYTKVEYERIVLRSDDVHSKLIYGDSKTKEVFRKFKIDLLSVKNNTEKEMLEIYGVLKDRVLGFKARYERLMKSEPMQSDALFAEIRRFCSEVYSLFLHKFERCLYISFAKLELFISKLDIKIVNNYENAIKLATSFIEQKIERACQNYESDPTTFGLYYPKLEEINERMLLSLCCYEFEDELTGPRPFMSRFLNDVMGELSQIKDENISHIKALRSKYLKDIEDIKHTTSGI